MRRLLSGIGLAGVIATGVAAPTAAMAYCSEPLPPSCASGYGSFRDEAEFERCERELDRYFSDVDRYAACVRREAEDVVAEAQDRARDTARSLAARRPAPSASGWD